MALRKAEIVTDRREGRYIYYRLKNPRTLELIRLAGTLSGVPEASLLISSQLAAVDGCCCPHCTPENEEEGPVLIHPEVESL
jgi:cystathionine beta-lyase/cystathionine gamma-synthase